MTVTLPAVDDRDVEPTPVWTWAEFTRYFSANWEQGQHVTLIGPTGKGKTTLALQLLPLRRYIVAFCVKRRDKTMEKAIRKLGLWRMQRFHGDVYDRIALWPDIRGTGRGHRVAQEEEFRSAFDAIFRMGGWCVWLDEVSYLADTLKLGDECKFLLQQGRSSGISIVGATQRPAWIPVAFYDQATHLFFWRDNDHRNLRRLGELAGNASHVVQREVATLSDYEILYYHRDTGFRVRTKVEV